MEYTVPIEINIVHHMLKGVQLCTPFFVVNSYTCIHKITFGKVIF